MTTNGVMVVVTVIAFGTNVHVAEFFFVYFQKLLLPAGRIQSK